MFAYWTHTGINYSISKQIWKDLNLLEASTLMMTTCQDDGKLGKKHFDFFLVATECDAKDKGENWHVVGTV